MRIGESTPARDYLAADLADVWKRYVLPTRREAQQAQRRNTEESSSQSATPGPAGNDQKEAAVADVADVALLRPWEAEDMLYDFEERAAILEYDGRFSRAEAEALAAEELPDLPAFLDRRAPAGLKLRCRSLMSLRSYGPSIAARSSQSLKRHASPAGQCGRSASGACFMTLAAASAGDGPCPKVALAMWLDGNKETLAAYLAGDRSSPTITEYFDRCGVPPLRASSAPATDLALGISGR